MWSTVIVPPAKPSLVKYVGSVLVWLLCVHQCLVPCHASVSAQLFHQKWRQQLFAGALMSTDDRDYQTDQFWVPIDDSFPSIVSSDNPNKLEQFFYIRGKYDSHHKLSKEFLEHLHQYHANGSNVVTNFKVDFEFWHNNLKCVQSYIVYPKTDIEHSINNQWNYVERQFVSVAEFEKFDVWIFANSEGCDNSLMAVKNLNVRYDVLQTVDNDQKSVSYVDNSPIVQLNYVKNPEQTKVQESVYLYDCDPKDQCSLVVSKPAEKIDIKMKLFSDSADANMDSKFNDITLKVAKATWNDFEIKHDWWENNTASYVKLNFLAKKSVVVVSFLDSPGQVSNVTNGFVLPVKSKSNSFIVENKNLFLVNPTISTNETAVVKLKENISKDNCFELKYHLPVDNKNQKCKFNLWLEAIESESILNRYQVLQWTPFQTETKIDFCMKDFQLLDSLTNGKFRLVFEYSGLVWPTDTKDETLLVSVDEVSEKTPSKQETPRPDIWNFVPSGAQKFNPWKLIVPGTFEELKKDVSFGTVKVAEFDKAYQLHSVWLHNGVWLRNSHSLSVRIEVDSNTIAAKTLVSVRKAIKVKGWLCDEAMQCITNTGTLIEQKPDTINYSTELKPHPNANAAAVKVLLTVTVESANLEPGTEKPTLKVYLENFADPCETQCKKDHQKCVTDPFNKASEFDVQPFQCQCEPNWTGDQCSKKDYCDEDSKKICESLQSKCHNNILNNNFECICSDKSLEFQVWDRTNNKCTNKKAAYDDKLEKIRKWTFPLDQTVNTDLYDVCWQLNPVLSKEQVVELKFNIGDSIHLLDNKFVIPSGQPHPSVDVCLSDFITFPHIQSISDKSLEVIIEPENVEEWKNELFVIFYSKLLTEKPDTNAAQSVAGFTVSNMVPKKIFNVSTVNSVEKSFKISLSKLNETKVSVFSKWYVNHVKDHTLNKKVDQLKLINIAKSPVDYTLMLCPPRVNKDAACVRLKTFESDEVMNALTKLKSDVFQLVLEAQGNKADNNENDEVELNASLWNRCANVECQNKATCTTTNDLSTFHCECAPGFVGDLCQVKEDEVCDNKAKEKCNKINAQCDPLTSQCKCITGYRFNSKTSSCDRTELIKVHQKCLFDTDKNLMNCFLDKLAQQMSHLPKYFPRRNHLENGSPIVYKDLYFSVQSNSKITVPVNQTLLKGNERLDICVAFKYFVSPGATLKLLHNDQLDLVSIGSTIPIVNNGLTAVQTNDFTISLSAKQTICVRRLVSVKKFEQLEHLTFLVQSTSADGIVAIQMLPHDDNSMLEYRLVSEPMWSLASEYFAYISRKSSEQNKLNETIADDLTAQWPVLFPTDRWSVLEPDTFQFKKLNTDTKEVAHLESHWLTRPIRGDTSNVHLDFDIKVYRPVQSIERISVYLIDENRKLLATVETYEGNNLVQEKHIGDPLDKDEVIHKNVLVNTFRVDLMTKYKVVIEIKYQDKKNMPSEKKLLFELSSISFGDPCLDNRGEPQKCYNIDLIEDSTIKCQRLLQTSGDVQFQCDCDTEKGLGGPDCKQINYCKYPKPEKTDNDTVTNGDEYCGPEAKCLDVKYDDKDFLCLCSDNSKSFNFKEKRCENISKCLTNPCDFETEICEDKSLTKDDTTVTDRVCKCKEGYERREVSELTTTNQTSCVKKDQCSELNPCPDPLMNCLTMADSDSPHCFCPQGFRKQDNKCVSEMCSFPGLNHCAQQCVNTQQKPYHQCQCHPLYEQKGDNTTDKCVLKSNAPDSCKQCANDPSQVCRMGNCMCKDHFMFDENNKCVPNDLIMACPENRFKFDEHTNSYVCDCDNDSDNYWATNNDGSCTFAKSVCDIGEYGRLQCSQRDALCHFSQYDVNDFACVCSIGKVFVDQKPVKSAAELTAHPEWACIDVCEVQLYENHCASVGAKCNSVKLFEKIVIEKKSSPKETEYCDCVPGTFWYKGVCTQFNESSLLRVTYLWSHPLQSDFEKKWVKYSDSKIPFKPTQLQSKLSIEYLDPNSFGLAKKRSIEKNLEEDELAREQWALLIKSELIFQKTQILMETFGWTTKDDLVLVSVASDESSGLANDQNTLTIDVAIRDLPNGIQKGVNNYCHNFDSQYCVFPYLSIVLDNSTISYNPLKPCENIKTCQPLSNCIVHETSYFSCECNTKYFEMTKRYTFKADYDYLVLKNELCQSKPLCSSCLQKSDNQQCIEEDPILNSDTLQWTKQALCSCRDGYVRDEKDQCVSVCYNQTCNGNGKCVRNGIDSISCECDSGYYGPQCQWTLMSTTGWIVAVTLLSIVAVLGIGTTLYFYQRSLSRSSTSTKATTTITTRITTIDQNEEPNNSNIETRPYLVPTTSPPPLSSSFTSSPSSSSQSVDHQIVVTNSYHQQQSASDSEANNHYQLRIPRISESNIATSIILQSNKSSSRLMVNTSRTEQVEPKLESSFSKTLNPTEQSTEKLNVPIESYSEHTVAAISQSNCSKRTKVFNMDSESKIVADSQEMSPRSFQQFANIVAGIRRTRQSYRLDQLD